MSRIRHANVKIAELRREILDAGGIRGPVNQRAELWMLGDEKISIRIISGRSEVIPRIVSEVRGQIKRHLAKTKENKVVHQHKPDAAVRSTELYGGDTPEVGRIFEMGTDFRPFNEVGVRILVDSIDGDSVYVRLLGPPVSAPFFVTTWDAILAPSRTDAPGVSAPPEEPEEETPTVRAVGHKGHSPGMDAVVTFVLSQNHPVKKIAIQDHLGIGSEQTSGRVQRAVHLGLLSARGEKAARRYWRPATQEEWDAIEGRGSSRPDATVEVVRRPRPAPPEKEKKPTTPSATRNRPSQVSIDAAAAVLAESRGLMMSSEVAFILQKDPSWTIKCLNAAIEQQPGKILRGRIDGRIRYGLQENWPKESTSKTADSKPPVEKAEPEAVTVEAPAEVLPTVPVSARMFERRVREALGVRDEDPEKVLELIRALRHRNSRIAEALEAAGWTPEVNAWDFIAAIATDLLRAKTLEERLHKKLDQLGVQKTSRKSNSLGLEDRLATFSDLKTISVEVEKEVVREVVKEVPVPAPVAPEPAPASVPTSRAAMALSFDLGDDVAHVTLKDEHVTMVYELLSKIDVPAVRFVLGRAPSLDDVLDRVFAAGIPIVEEGLG